MVGYGSQAFVILLLVLRTTNGSKCYFCAGDKESDCYTGKNTTNGITQVPCENAYCILSRREDIIYRACLDFQLYADCFIRAYKHNETRGCRKAGENPRNNLGFVNCLKNKSVDWEIYLKVEEEWYKDEEKCICRGDLCNKGGGIKPTSLIIIILPFLFGFM